MAVPDPSLPLFLCAAIAASTASRISIGTLGCAPTPARLGRKPRPAGLGSFDCSAKQEEPANIAGSSHSVASAVCYCVLNILSIAARAASAGKRASMAIDFTDVHAPFAYVM